VVTDDDGLKPMLHMLARLPEKARGRIAGIYATTVTDMVAQLEGAIASRDPEATRTIAHKIAGAAAMVQDIRLSSLTRSMEKSVLQGSSADAFALWPQAQAAAAESLAALHAAYPPVQ
jgi:HPt (histidine-containing phosphotransfer) domain-containing protein